MYIYIHIHTHTYIYTHTFALINNRIIHISRYFTNARPSNWQHLNFRSQMPQASPICPQIRQEAHHLHSDGFLTTMINGITADLEAEFTATFHTDRSDDLDYLYSFEKAVPWMKSVFLKGIALSEGLTFWMQIIWWMMLLLLKVVLLLLMMRLRDPHRLLLLFRTSYWTYSFMCYRHTTATFTYKTLPSSNCPRYFIVSCADLLTCDMDPVAL